MMAYKTPPVFSVCTGNTGGIFILSDGGCPDLYYMAFPGLCAVAGSVLAQGETASSMADRASSGVAQIYISFSAFGRINPFSTPE